ncbi:MAG TPA: hypothetical protein VFZ34_16830, partial [Blastocatellia bacterium]|nr:hypothetical protein [Blastocatellia bacterium]
NAAHNDYLQLLAEGGVIAGVLTLWLLVAWGHALGQALRSADSIAQALALGSGAATLGMLVHSIFDFNLQLPSHALLFLTFVGVLTQLGARVAVQEAALMAQATPAGNYFDLAEPLSERELL